MTELLLLISQLVSDSLNDYYGFVVKVGVIFTVLALGFFFGTTILCWRCLFRRNV